LEVAEQEEESLNNVNYATIMSQLGRIRSFNKEDPRFLALLQALAALIEERGLPWIQARSAANIVHAIGKMDLRNPSTKRILEWIAQPQVAAHFVEEAEPQNVANVAWACAKLGFEAPKLFAVIEGQSKWLVEEGDPQNVANTAWACATLGLEAPNLFAEIELRSKWLVEEGNPQAVANTAWAFATLGFEASALFSELNQHADRFIALSNPQFISNMCYAIAVLGKSRDSYALLAKLWGRAITHGEDFIDEELRQLAQTLILAEADDVKLPHIPERMAKKMELVRNTVDENVSRSSKQVSQLLHEIGFHHECEVSPNGLLSSGMLAIDFACLEQQVAIEFDGPRHYLQAVGSGKLTLTENGATKAKRRYLEQIGWKVINIDYRDYELAKSASNEKQWLQELLNASGVPLSNEQILKNKADGVASGQKELNAREKKVGFLSEPAINNRIPFKNVVKKNSDRFEDALVNELTARGITSIPMTKRGKPDFVKMKAAMKAWALEGDNDPKAKQDKMYRASFVPKCPALWTSIFEELNEQSDPVQV